LRLAGSMLPNIHLEHFTTDLLVCSDTWLRELNLFVLNIYLGPEVCTIQPPSS
jgi:hypothetical protein